MSKDLYENQWVPLAEAATIPQIEYDLCVNCGVKKELRMYGDNDDDKRCYECGKGYYIHIVTNEDIAFRRDLNLVIIITSFVQFL